MQSLIWEYSPNGLRAPALVCAFKGWNDAGDAATSALSFIGSQLGARQFARIDPEEFFNFQETRPHVKLVEGRTRELIWPAVEIYEVRIPRAHRDLILLSGVEPSLRWRTFSAAVVELAEAVGAQIVVTLGALLADVAHTRPVAITGVASDEALLEHLAIEPPNYEGPTGIVGVLHATCAALGMPSASLWAAVPHYVAAAPNPKAALALVRKLEAVVGISVDASDLEQSASTFERQVTLAVNADTEIKEFVEQLERAADDAVDFEPEDIPSGDVIAREFQRFLRQRGSSS